MDWENRVKTTAPEIQRLCPDWAWEAIASGMPEEEVTARLGEWLQKQDGRTRSPAALRFLYTLYREEYVRHRNAQ